MRRFRADNVTPQKKAPSRKPHRSHPSPTKKRTTDRRDDRRKECLYEGRRDQSERYIAAKQLSPTKKRDVECPRKTTTGRENARYQKEGAPLTPPTTAKTRALSPRRRCDTEEKGKTVYEDTSDTTGTSTSRRKRMVGLPSFTKKQDPVLHQTQHHQADEPTTSSNESGQYLKLPIKAMERSESPRKWLFGGRKNKADTAPKKVTTTKHTKKDRSVSPHHDREGFKSRRKEPLQAADLPSPDKPKRSSDRSRGFRNRFSDSESDDYHKQVAIAKGKHKGGPLLIESEEDKLYHIKIEKVSKSYDDDVTGSESGSVIATSFMEGFGFMDMLLTSPSYSTRHENATQGSLLDESRVERSAVEGCVLQCGGGGYGKGDQNSVAPTPYNYKDESVAAATWKDESLISVDSGSLLGGGARGKSKLRSMFRNRAAVKAKKDETTDPKKSVKWASKILTDHAEPTPFPFLPDVACGGTSYIPNTTTTAAAATKSSLPRTDDDSTRDGDSTYASSIAQLEHFAGMFSKSFEIIYPPSLPAARQQDNTTATTLTEASHINSVEKNST
eukprot:scaffold4274_cov175-Amphora_coffeaeformis.AAC.14